MKIGIIGSGMIVNDLLTTFDQFNFDKVALFAREESKDKAEQLANKYNLDQIFYNYDELLASEYDIMYIALPNHLHYSFSKKALLANKHVIIEKPITANSKELEELIDIAKERNLMIFEAMNIHYLPAYQGIKDNLYKIGKIKIVSFNYSQYSSRYNAFKEGNILPAFDYHKAGGALMDINIYNINAVIGLFGLPKESNYLANIENNIDTSGIMTFDYEDFKGICIGAKDCKAPIISTIQGDQGVIVIDGPINQLTRFELIKNNGDKEEFIYDNTKHRLSYEFFEFIKIINDKDYERQARLLEQSLNIVKIIGKTRKEKGVVFDNDR